MKKHEIFTKAACFLIILMLLSLNFPAFVQALNFSIPKSLTQKHKPSMPQPSKPGEGRSAADSNAETETYLVYDSAAEMPMMKVQLPGKWNILNGTSWDAEQALCLPNVSLRSEDGREFDFQPAIFLTLQENKVNGQEYSTAGDPELQAPELALAFPQKIYSADEFVRETLVTLMQQNGMNEAEILFCDILEENDPDTEQDIRDMLINEEHEENGVTHSHKESLVITALSYKLKGKALMTLHFFVYFQDVTLSKQANGDYDALAVFGPREWMSYSVPFSDSDEERAVRGSEFMDIGGSVEINPLWMKTTEQFAALAQAAREAGQALDSGKILEKASAAARQETAMKESYKNGGWEELAANAAKVTNGLSGRDLQIYRGDYLSVWSDQENRVFYFWTDGQPDQYSDLAEIEWGELLP